MLSKFFVDRPVFATVLSLVVVILGLVALVELPVAQYPEVAPPTIQITAVYPGANADVLAKTVATPIEQEINGVERMLYISSKCGNDGVMAIDVTFELGTDLDTAQVLVQNRVAIAEPKLPEEVRRQGVLVKKRSPNILLVVNIVSDVEPNDTNYRDNLYLSNYASLNVKDALARLPGVGDISLFGAREYSMRIWLNPEMLAARNLNVTDVMRALQEQNVQVAAGRIGQQPAPTGSDIQLSISTQGRLLTPDEFKDIIVKIGDQRQIVHLGDIARIELGAKNYDTSSYLDGKEALGLAIFQRPGTNALGTAEQIKAEMKKLKKEKFPVGVDYKIVYDTTTFVQESVDGVYHTLIEAFILVFIVVLIFLQDWRATILPMIDVPVSLIGTFAVMALFGFSLNNLTLFGLVLAIGIVVDDAIVVVENVERWLAKGYDAREATLKAMSEVTGPVIAITLVLFSVFIPTAFIAGINGQFYRQFALTIAASTGISAMNALTMTPSRTAQIFKNRTAGVHGQHGEALPWWGIGGLIGFLTLFLASGRIAPLFGLGVDEHGAIEGEAWKVWGMRALVMAIALGIGYGLKQPVNYVLGKFFVVFNAGFEFVTNAYGKVVAGLLRISVVMLIVYVGLLVMTWIGFQRIPTGFIPQQDKGYLIVAVTLPDGAGLERTEAILKKVGEIAMKDDAVANAISIPGLSLLTGTNLSNNGTMFLPLKPFSVRKGNPNRGADATAGRLYMRYRELREAAIFAFSPPPVDGIGNAGGFKLQVEDQAGLGYTALQDAVDNLARKATSIPGMAPGTINTTFRANEPQLYLDIDRVKARSAGVPLTELFSTLQGYLGSAYVNDFTTLDRNWQVTMQADQNFRATRESIGKLKVRNNSGKMVPLDALLEVRDITGPAFVSHYQLYPSADLSGSTLPGFSSGEAIRAMSALADAELPDGMAYEWSELSLQEVMASQDLMTKLVFPLAVLFVYMVLAAQYESWTLPFSVILIVPMCILAAVAGLTIARMDNNVFTQIGLVVLIAMASKNAILIVEFARQRQLDGLPLREATIEACVMRLRPIIMTSLAFILGVVPLVLAKGAGSEMRIALGVAVFSGMLGVTIFGIFFTPVFYYILMYFRKAPSTGPHPEVAIIPPPSMNYETSPTPIGEH